VALMARYLANPVTEEFLRDSAASPFALAADQLRKAIRLRRLRSDEWADFSVDAYVVLPPFEGEPRQLWYFVALEDLRDIDNVREALWHQYASGSATA
jgi:hypothetical protein